MRKGISMTLTIIIVAVVLMVVGLTLVTLFGAGIGDFFDVASDTADQAQIESSCENVRQDISDRICGGYTNADGDSFSPSADETHNVSCVEAGCSIDYEDGEASFENSDPVDITVQHNGDTFNCQDFIFLPQQCPVM